MRDKFFLLNSWPFLVENIQTLVSTLQAKAAEVRCLFLFGLVISSASKVNFNPLEGKLQQ
jgi:hypothetical protein